jgi:hypothetical protein
MINAEFLAGCGDEQVNAGVAWLESSKLNILHVEFDSPWRVSGHGVISSYGRKFFSCHNPSDIMPIAFANKINMRFSVNNGWLARNKSILSYNTNPLRSICEVYILMSVVN